MLTGFKIAEWMASLARVRLTPVSRAGIYKQPPLDDLKRFRQA